MAAGFQDIVETYEVALDIGIRVGDAITYTCLGCKINNDIGIVFVKDFINQCFISDISLNKNPFLIASLSL